MDLRVRRQAQEQGLPTRWLLELVGNVSDRLAIALHVVNESHAQGFRTQYSAGILIERSLKTLGRDRGKRDIMLLQHVFQAGEDVPSCELTTTRFDESGAARLVQLPLPTHALRIAIPKKSSRFPQKIAAPVFMKKISIRVVEIRLVLPVVA